MTGFVKNKDAYDRASVGAPLYMERDSVSEQDALTIPGCCVKSRERQPGGWPRYFGRIRDIKDDAVTVIGAGYGEHVFVWTGTHQELNDTWECD